MNFARIAVLSLLGFVVVQGCSCEKKQGQLDKKYGDIGLVAVDDTVKTGEIIYDFGAEYMGKSRTLNVRVKNTNSGALTLKMLEKLEGDVIAIGQNSDGTAPVFKIEFVADREVASGETFTMVATFAPPQQADGRKIQDHSVKLRLRAENTPPEKDTALITLVGRGVSGVCEIADTLDFGSVAAADVVKQLVELKNPTEISAAAYVGDITGADAAVFKLSVDSPKGSFDIAAKSSRLVTLSFEPPKTRELPYKAYIRMRATEQCPEVIVNLIGRAVDSVLSWEPKGCIDFGYVTPGIEVQKDITFKNDGNTDILMTAIKSLQPAEFKVISSPSPDLTKLTLTSKGGTAVMRLAFKPSVLGPRTTQLSFQSNLPKQPTGSVCLKGYGGGPDIQVNPSPNLNFGKIAYFAGQGTFQTRKLSVLNVGTKPPIADNAANLHLGKNGTDKPYAVVKVLGSTLAGEITIADPTTYNMATGLIAQPGLNLADFQVKVTPSSIGVKQAEITIYSDDPDEPEVKINVVAEAVVMPPCNYSILPGHLSFGLVTPPDHKELSFSIVNNGRNTGENCLISNVDLGLGTDVAFSLPAGPVASAELLPGQSLDVVVRVWPQTAATSGVPTISGTTEFFVSSPTSPTGKVTMDANIGTSCLTIAPDDLDFGTVKTGCKSVSRTFNIYNTCTASVKIMGFAMQDGAGFAAGTAQCPGTTPCPEFFLQSTPAIPGTGLTLASGGTPLTFQSYYQPKDFNKDNGAISIDVVQNGLPVKYLVTLAGTGDSVGLNTDTFRQDGKPKADILLTIDNSGSMSEEQASLAANFSAFIKYAISASVDYHIGVTTTDMTKEGGRLLGDASNPKVLTPTTPDVETKFKSKVNVGTSGSATEMGFAPSLAALTAPLVTTDNVGFIRDDANLAVVVITDELEQSTQPTTFYYNSFLNIKGFKRATAFTFNAIAGFSKPAGCTAELDNGRYTSMANLTNGVKENICTPDWSKSLEQLGKTAFGFRTNFFLNATPDLSGGKAIKITIDGIDVPTTDSHGAAVWHYDSVANSVNFEPMFVPEPGQTMTVTYYVTCVTPTP
jgi:hypothetical protein